MVKVPLRSRSSKESENLSGTTSSWATSTLLASRQRPKVSPRLRLPLISTPVCTNPNMFSNANIIFSIDGIVNVSAKDKATGKDQSMTVASSSGLNDKDIEKMVADAEKFADEDKARKNVIEMANKADSFCAETEKAISEHSAQLDNEEKTKLQELLAGLRELAVKGQTGDAEITAETIKESMDKAQTASLALFQKVYEKKNSEPQAEEKATPEADVVDEKPKKD
ncbi:70-kilodalton heat shock protein [Serendipita sp. 411]|nr:70-kilodalton heat shock protein [Serendipita sp. 411]